MSLMQNDTKATGKGATYAKLEVLLSKQMDAKTMTGAEKLLFIFSFINFMHWERLVTLRLWYRNRKRPRSVIEWFIHNRKLSRFKHLFM